MRQQDNPTIEYRSLPDATQQRIEGYPEHGYTFFVKRHGQGYQIRSVEKSQLDSLAAQGGMGKGWLKVVYGPYE